MLIFKDFKVFFFFAPFNFFIHGDGDGVLYVFDSFIKFGYEHQLNSEISLYNKNYVINLIIIE